MSKVEHTVSQIRRIIHASHAGEDRLPSEPELARMLVTSRATIRQALAELEMDGLIYRKHGSGTFINQHILGIHTRLEEVWDFDEMIRLAGYAPDVRHQELHLEQAGSELAECLSLEPSEEVLSTANVFLANEVPVIYCVDVIPARLVSHAYREEELHGPVYTFLAERCDQQIDHNVTEVTPIVADARLAELLECGLGSPLHYFEEIGYNISHEPVIFSKEYYRPEFFSFKVIRKMTTRRRTYLHEQPEA